MNEPAGADNEPAQTATAANFNADATAKLLGLSDLQKRLCLAKLRGANWTQAAREAGYQGDGDQIRSAAHRASKSSKVVRFLELAALEGGGVADVPMDATERHRVLSRMARGTDKNSAIRACEILQRMDAEARAIEAAHANEGNPVDTLNEIAQLSPMTAITLAKKYDFLEWKPTPDMLARARDEARAYFPEEMLNA
jgi:hypothetical protein